MYLPQMAVLEASFFSALDLLGYFRGCGLCLMPWIITFTQNWFKNVAEFLLLVSENGVYDADNMILLMAFFAVRLLIASEVFYMALHDWTATKNIKRERQNRIFEN